MTATRLSLQLADIAQSKSDSFVDGPFGSNLKTSDFVSTGIPLVRVQHIGVGVFKDGFDQFVPSSKFHELSRHSARSGDIVFAKMGDPIGRSALIPPGVDQALIVADCVRLRVDESKANKQYVTWILNSEPMLDQIARRGKGATRQRVNLSDFKTVQIPLPPLSDQERIVRILNEVEALRRLRAQADARTEGVTATLFQTMFSDAQAAANHWPIKPLGEICSTVSGATPSTENADFWSGTIPWISPKDMKSRELFDATDHVSDSALEASRLRLLPVNAVLVVVRGMILAHTFPVATTQVQATINQDMKALLVHEGILPEYLHWLLVSNALRILSLVSTAGHGTKRLEMNALLSLPVAVPPKPRQKDFAARVAEIHQLEAAQAASRQRLDDLFQSLLHRAFQGEL